MQCTDHPAATVHSLDVARERRFYITVAQENEAWLETKASFSLSGIELTDDDAERAGRMIACYLPGHRSLSSSSPSASNVANKSVAASSASG